MKTSFNSLGFSPAEKLWPSLQFLRTPWSVYGETHGAVHLLPDEPGWSVLCCRSRGHSVSEQRSLLGRSLRHLGLLQLSATQGQCHSQQYPQGYRLITARDSKPTTAGHTQEFRSILGHTEIVMIRIHLFPTQRAEVGGSLLV